MYRRNKGRRWCLLFSPEFGELAGVNIQITQDLTTGGDRSETGHAGISSCWTPMRSKAGNDPPRLSRWTSSQSSAASRIRRMA